MYKIALYFLNDYETHSIIIYWNKINLELSIIFVFYISC